MAIRGALVKKAISQTSADYSSAAAVTWNSEVYDTDGFHDIGSNTTRLTVPAAVDGSYGIIHACISLSATLLLSYGLLQITKNGVITYIGCGAQTKQMSGNGQGGGQDRQWLQVSTGPMLLVAGDYYEAVLLVEDASITVESESNFSILVLDNNDTTGRCLVKKNANQTAANYQTAAVIAFDGTDTYDSHAIHDPSSNNSKLIIPASLHGKYASVFAQAKASSVITSTTLHSIAIRMGGSLTYDGFAGNSGVNGGYSEAWIHARTPAIQLATGNEFEALYYNDDTSITLEAAYTFLGLNCWD